MKCIEVTRIMIKKQNELLNAMKLLKQEWFKEANVLLKPGKG